MIIEVTGPTGSGKSTVAAKLGHALRKRGYPVIHIGEGGTGIGAMPAYITEASQHGLRTDLRLFLWASVFILLHPAFFAFSAIRILQAEGGFRTRVAIFRSVWRKAGLAGYFTSRRFRKAVIVIDEGVFHSAHNFLVFPSKRIGARAIRIFGYLVPLPELLLINRAHPAELARRLRERGDLSNRVTPETLGAFCDNAALVFDSLSGMRRIRNRSLDFNIGDPAESEFADILARVETAV